MSVSREQIGARLRRHRKALGFTQKQVAGVLGVHRPTISEIEAGRRDVTSDELFEFARLYVTRLGELLAEPTPTEDNVVAVLFRRPGLETPEARRAVRKFMQRCRDERELEELLGVQPDNRPRPSFHVRTPQDKCEAIQQGNEMALQERRRLNIGTEPIRNPLDLLEQQGVRIGPLDDDDGTDVDGLYFETDELGAWVAVNLRRDDRTGFRAAFTAAHEYAHWLLQDVKVEEFNFGQRAEELSEVRANAFAAAFLMPADGLKAYFANLALVPDAGITHLSPADIVRAMDYFGVSRQALLYRLKNVRLLDQEVADNLLQSPHTAEDVARIAMRLGLQLRRQEYLSTRLPALAIQAWRRGLISTGRAADLLDLDIATFKDLMHDLGEFQEFADDDELLGAVAGD